MTTQTTIYTTGGTVQAGGGIYIPRQADDELLELCRRGTFAYILTARQLGKSSLMVRTAERLGTEGVQTAIVDLTRLGIQVSAEEWYRGLLVEIDDTLEFDTDVLQWWRDHNALGMAQRLTRFFTEIVLAEIDGPVVIFVDEIDSTLSLDFTDDFFAAIRALYNARANNPDLQRLSFVLIGVATPSDLIRNPKRTPFNIGERVDLTDFTFDEARPLADGLPLPPDVATKTLRHILHWTGGHPYLTQRLCRAVAEGTPDGIANDSDGSDGSDGSDVGAQHAAPLPPPRLRETDINQIVTATFLGEQSEKDHNLQFVADMLTKRSPYHNAALKTYRAIRRGRDVPDDEQSLTVNHLKLAGIVRRKSGMLRLRNRIYFKVFDEGWIKRHTPVVWSQRARQAAIGAIIALVITLALLAPFTAYLSQQAEQARQENETVALAFRAQTISHDPELGLLLAIEATEQLPYNSFVEAVLHRTIESSRVRQRFQGHLAAVQSAVFSPDGSRVVSASDDRTVRVWDAESGAPLRVLQGHTAGVLSAAFSPDGSRIVSASLDGTVRIWDFTTGKELHILQSHTAGVLSAAFSPDGTIIASASQDNMVRISDSTTGRELHVLQGHTSGVTNVAFSPDGTKIASASADGRVRIWNAQSGKELSVLKDHLEVVWSATFSPDGTKIVSASGNGKVYVWDTKSNSELRVLQGHADRVLSAAFSPDGSHIVSASADGTVRVWDSTTGRELYVLRGHTAGVVSATFSPDGTRIVSASSDDTVRIWDTASGTELRVLAGHTAGVWSAAFSPDGSHIVSASTDGTVRVWDAASRKVRVLLGHTSVVRSAVFSPDGSRIVSVAHDRSVRVWDTASGTEMRLLQGHTKAVYSAAFSPDGSRIVSASGDATVRIWRGDFNLLELAKSRVTRELTPEERAQYLGEPLPTPTAVTQ